MLRPLISLQRYLPAGSAAAQEVDYMLARTMCALDQYKDNLGCEYCQTLSGMYGRYVWFGNTQHDTAAIARACCPPPAPPQAGVRIIQSQSRARPSYEILEDVAASLPVTTSLNAQRTEFAVPGDWITGFRVIAVERAGDNFWHWMIRLEVSYVYHIGHGSIMVCGFAAGGPFTSGYSYWGPVQDQPYGPQFRKGVQKVRIAIQLLAPQVSSTLMTLYLQEGTPPYRRILTQEFPFSQVFSLP